MHPNLFGITNSSYWLFLSIGFLACVIMYRIMTGVKSVSGTGAGGGVVALNNKTYNFYSYLGLASIAAGLVFAVIFQAFYDIPYRRGLFFGGLNGQFGLTFMGGFVGGAAVFILGTWRLAKPEVKKDFWTVCNILAPSVPVAIFFARIGCFLAGCCHGAPTNSFLGVVFPRGSAAANQYGYGVAVHPTQLYEAFFCLLLAAVMLVIFYLPKIKKDDSYAKYRDYLLVILLFSYSVFRFFLEFVRGDYRGGMAGGISPSQWQSILMFGAAVAVLIVVHVKKIVPFAGKQAIAAAETATETEQEKNEDL